MSLKAKVEAIIYAAEEPVTLEQISLLLKDIVLADLASAKENAAIEQADSAAESKALAKEAEAAESALPPELAPESEELICPELGPLMPDAGTAQSESAKVAADDEASEPNGEACDAKEATGQEEATGASAPESPTPAENTPSDSLLETASTEETPAPTESVSAEGESAPAESASVTAPETTSRKRQPKKTEKEISEDKAVRARMREILIELVTDYASEDRGMEIRQVAGGFRMATKPEHHDVVRAFAKSLKPPIRLSLAALETLAVIAYKQPITGPEIADIRGVESASVLGTLLDRKLITTAGRKQVIGRPMQYKTSKDFLLRFGLNDVSELPSMEEFSQLASDGTIEIAPPEQQETLFEPRAEGTATQGANTVADTEDATGLATPESQDTAATETQINEPSAAESEDLEAQDKGSQIPESQPPDAAEAADSQPQSDAESSNIPETEHPIGQ